MCPYEIHLFILELREADGSGLPLIIASSLTWYFVSMPACYLTLEIGKHFFVFPYRTRAFFPLQMRSSGYCFAYAPFHRV